jgi:DNA helicase-4
MTPWEAELDPDSEEYYVYRRNECERSLRGEMVKSRGEKYIADFLLEHDIRYSYERTYFVGSERIYRPDFTLFVDARQLILEHWAIDPTDPMAQIPVTWKKMTKEYRAEIREKRAYWQEKGIVLLETNTAQLGKGREGFEAALKTLLEEHGLRCSRLTQEEISARISDSATRKLVELFSQLISRAKKSDLSPEAVRLAYRNRTRGDSRTRAFGSLAWRVYEAYEQQMRIDGCTDYDTLLSTATARVETAVGDLVVDDRSRGAFNVSATKWLLVDEYQDFSQLFSRLLESLLAFNTSLRLLCVGDNWQAINGFAGSEVRFIEDFERLSPEPDVLRLPLLVNRRSRERIVAAGNRLMRGEPGQPATASQDNVGGKVTKLYVDDVYVDLRTLDPKSGETNPDACYIVRPGGEDTRPSDALASKYLKLVAEIIRTDPTKSYSVLTRTNWVSSIRLTDFETRLRSCLGAEFLQSMEKEGKRIDVSTVHSYKGGESDVSIVLRVTTRQFPLIHPDSALLAPIGETLERVIAEERRLFYVAISRAKEELVLVTEKERESDFLSDILGSAG